MRKYVIQNVDVKVDHIMTLLVVILLISLTFTEALHRRISPRIAGGEIVKKREDFPYQVLNKYIIILTCHIKFVCYFQASLRIFDQHYCGAAIITNQHVLTAAHCIYDAHDQPLAAQYFTVVVGDLNLKPSADTVTKDVIRITCHDDYEPSKLSHDVAVVKVFSNKIILRRVIVNCKNFSLLKDLMNGLHISKVSK